MFVPEYLLSADLSTLTNWKGPVACMQFILLARQKVTAQLFNYPLNMLSYSQLNYSIILCYSQLFSAQSFNYSHLFSAQLSSYLKVDLLKGCSRLTFTILISSSRVMTIEENVKC